MHVDDPSGSDLVTALLCTVSPASRVKRGQCFQHFQPLGTIDLESMVFVEASSLNCMGVLRLCLEFQSICRDSTALILVPDCPSSGFTSLPLLLFQGNSALCQLVSEWLQTSFDCHISPYSLEQDDLSLLLGQYATTARG